MKLKKNYTTRNVRIYILYNFKQFFFLSFKELKNAEFIHQEM